VVVAAISVTIVLWGSAFVAIRAAAPSLGFQSLVCTRLLLGAAVFAILAKPLRVTRPALRQVPLLVALAATGLVGYLMLLSAGESQTPAGVSAMIFAAAPILVLLLARGTLGEQLHARRRCGVMIALAGAAVVSATQGFGGGGSPIGVLLVLAAVCCYAPWVILSKRAVRTMPSQSIAAWSTWLAALMSLPFSTSLPHHLTHADPTTLGAVLFLGAVVTTAPLILWTWVLSRVSASVAGSSLLLIGPAAVLISWVALGEAPKLAALLGGAVTLAGVVLTQRHPTRHEHPRHRRQSPKPASTRIRRRGAEPATEAVA
jgi:drug/metabolite transporter (DMT)-like permease